MKNLRTLFIGAAVVALAAGGVLKVLSHMTWSQIWDAALDLVRSFRGLAR